MQPFYLSKNSSGFYKAYFVNTETGKVIATKSTHSTNKFETNQIASSWLVNGLPSSRTTSCSNYKNNGALVSGLDLQSIVNRLTCDEAIELNAMISARFGFAACDAVQNNVSETGMSVSSSPVLELHDDSVKPVLLIEALSNFWDFENSEYVKKTSA